MLRRPSQVRLIRDKEIDGPSALQFADDGRNVVDGIAGYRRWCGACRALLHGITEIISAAPHDVQRIDRSALHTRGIGEGRVSERSTVSCHLGTQTWNNHLDIAPYGADSSTSTP